MAEELNAPAPAEASVSDSGFDTGIDSGSESSTLDSTEDIVSALDKLDEGDGQVENADGSTGSADGSAASDGSGQEPAQAAPAVPMPDGWDDGMWKGLPPEVQAHINSRVQAHAQAIAAEKQAMANLREQQEQFTQQANAQMQQALATMQHIIEGEFAQVNWQELANSDPAMYVRLQQLYANRMGAVREVEQGIAQRVEQMRAAEKQKADAALETEYQSSLPEIKALFGAGFEGKRFVKDMADYMTANGVPREAVNGMSKGYELKFVAKAMLFDRMQQARASAAAKVAEAPKVAAPRSGAAQDNSGAGMTKAMRGLRANPNSTEALAAVLSQLR